MTTYSIKITYSDKSFTIVRMPATSVQCAVRGTIAYLRHNHNIVGNRTVVGWELR